MCMEKNKEREIGTNSFFKEQGIGTNSFLQEERGTELIQFFLKGTSPTLHWSFMYNK